MTIKLDSKFFRISYFLFAAAWALGDILQNKGDDFKYVFLIMTLGIGAVIIIKNYIDSKKIELKTAGLKYSVMVCGVIIIISSLYMIFNGVKILWPRYMFYMFIPMLLVFVIINIDKNENKDFYFDCILIGEATVFYFHFHKILDLQHILSISFLESYSPYESPLADYFCVLFVYYLAKKRMVRAGISAFLCFLSFKRIHVLFLFVLLLLAPIIRNKSLPSKLLLVTKIFFMASPMLLSILTSDMFVNWFQVTFGLDFQAFTMGRFGQITTLSSLDVPMYGFGSYDYYLLTNGYYVTILHCDLLRFYWETTFIGLFIFVDSYLNMVGKNMFAYILMTFMLIIMFMSTCIQMFLTWFLVFLVIQVLSYEHEESNIMESVNRAGGC